MFLKVRPGLLLLRTRFLYFTTCLESNTLAWKADMLPEQPSTDHMHIAQTTPASRARYSAKEKVIGSGIPNCRQRPSIHSAGSVAKPF